MSKFALTCYGGVGEVTGANFLIETSNKRILVDCGLAQGSKFSEEENYKDFAYDPASIDVLLVTHAHMDHIGRIPKLVKDGFKGVIYSTPETRELSEIMYDDALTILGMEANAHNHEKLYEREDVNRALSLWQGKRYHTMVEIDKDVSFYIKDAGHILGSAMYEMNLKGKRFLFTGDLGNSPSLLLRDTETPQGADYLLMESVYGDRNHESHKERDDRFKQILKDTIKRGGATVIPAFSLERTQNILYVLNEMFKNNELPLVPVFVDSPLAIRVTEIYRREHDSFNEKIQREIDGGDDIFSFPKLMFTMKARESDEIEMVANPKIIIAGSGMSSGGRVTKHELTYLNDPKSTILLVGYQSLGTIGRQIQEGASHVTIDGRSVRIKAHIENVQGFSSHKDSDNLLNFVSLGSSTLKKIFVVMGEPRASLFLVQKIKDNLGLDAIYPERSRRYEIEV